MNLGTLMQLKEEMMAFQTRHPKFPLFLKAVHGKALTEGTIIDIKVTAPDGQELTSNLKLTAEDLELIKCLSSQSFS